MRLESNSKMPFCIIIIFMLIMPAVQDAGEGYSGFRGKYLGQEIPGCKPEPFVPEFFSPWGDYGYHLVTSVYFSPDNRELFFTDQKLPVVEGRSCSVWYMQQIEGFWTQPRKASFSNGCSDKVTFFSPDGKRVHIVSTRPVSGQGPPKDYDIWYVKRNGEKWSEPTRLGIPINSEYNDLGGLMTRDGAIYFSSDRPGGMAGFDIYVARSVNGGYVESNLSEGVNTGAEEYIVHISYDESFVIFYRDNKLDEAYSGLYISYRDSTGKWTRAKSMGDHVSIIDARDATISPEGKYLFLLGHGGGVYWLKTDIIEYLKTEELEISKMLLNAVLYDGMSAAVRLYHELKKKHAGYIDLNEYLLNQRGHDFLETGRSIEAIALFQINIALFPDSWNAHDSMGEAYFQSGRLELAVQCYERSLVLNPNNEHAIKALEHIHTILND